MNRHAAIAVLVVLVLGLIAGGLYIARDPERKTVDATARAGAPGKFVRLSDGITQYDLSGPDTGRTVILFSGQTVPFYIWDSTATFLAAHGFRVLRYNYFGRGLSDRPTLAYDLATYDRQVAELLDSLGITGSVDAAGLSMGGVIATSFADRQIARLRSLTLIDPGFGDSSGPPFPLGIPLVGEYVMTVVVGPGMAVGQLDDFLHPERYPDWVPRYEPQMQYKGFLRANLATERGDVYKRPPASFTSLAKSGVPILVFWGRADRTVPFSVSEPVRAAFPRAEFVAVDSAAHLPHIEQAALVDSVMLRFLRAH